MFRSLPPLAIILGAAGVIPFVLFGFAAVGGAPDPALRATQALVGYGAVIMSFLGAVHWGFMLGEREEERAVRARLVLGVLPALVGWAAVLASIYLGPVLGLAIVIAGFVALLVVEHRANRLGLMPAGYMALRWVISVVVIALLAMVVVVRLVGGHVLL